MSPADPPPPLEVGEIQFFEAIVPPLEDGDYTLTATQTITGLPGDDPDPAVPPASLQFSVRGPRFALNPADIHSAYPPSATPTAYEGQLPHVVVGRKTLPWERLITADATTQTPWIGLLLIDQNDEGGIPKLNSGTVRDLLSDGGTIPTTTRGPAIKVSDLDNGESVDDPCTYIDIPSTLFAGIAPLREELPFLAHARGVNTGNKPIEGIIADGIYSVVIGNRVPKADSVNAAFLVSFEGFYSVLNGKKPAGADQVRLAVLHSWNFSLGDVDPFDQVMSATRSGLLAFAPPATTADLPEGSTTCTPDTITVSPPDPSSPDFAEQTATYALQTGYVPLTHALRDGSTTYSWYRGPLIPYLLGLSTGPAGDPTFESSDEALRYNPATGLFDASYAAAFELGRLLALQNESFVSTLHAYLHQVKGQALRTTNRVQTQQRHEQLDLDDAVDEPRIVGAVADAVVQWLLETGAEVLDDATAESPCNGGSSS